MMAIISWLIKIFTFGKKDIEKDKSDLDNKLLGFFDGLRFNLKKKAIK